MRAANIMGGHTDETDAAIDDVVEAKDRGIRLAAFEAIGKLSTSVMAYRSTIQEEDWSDAIASGLIADAQAAVMYLSPELQRMVARAIGIVEARSEILEVTGGGMHGSGAEIERLVATMLVRDLVGLPPKKVWPICGQCGEQSKDVAWHTNGGYRGEPDQCWKCYSTKQSAEAKASS
jgi:hypothetical protein